MGKKKGEEKKKENKNNMNKEKEKKKREEEKEERWVHTEMWAASRHRHVCGYACVRALGGGRRKDRGLVYDSQCNSWRDKEREEST